MHNPIIGGRRRDPNPEVSTPKPLRKKLGANDIINDEQESKLPFYKQESSHATQLPDAHEPHKERQEAWTEAEVMALYHANPGKCPICGIKSGRGFTGHLSKCLRISNSRIESTSTT